MAVKGLPMGARQGSAALACSYGMRLSASYCKGRELPRQCGTKRRGQVTHGAADCMQPKLAKRRAESSLNNIGEV